MEYVLAVLVAFVLAGAAWPNLVRSRPSYLLSAMTVVLVMLLYAIASVLIFPYATYPRAFIFFVAYLLETAAVVLFVLSATGLSLGGLLREIGSGVRQVFSGR
jgi:hypothetical protein